jgi:hypothetical protein
MSLRGTIVAVLCVGIAVAVILGFTHVPYPWFVLAGYWTIGLALILFERGRYRPKLSGTNFHPTSERYTDPVTGETIAVYVDDATGQRDYRPEPIGREPAPIRTCAEP